MQIEGKNIILTGASSGIGKELLCLLSSYENVKIIAVARHIEKIPVIEDKIIPFSADIGNKEGVDSLFNFSQKVFGNTDIFIANAGFAYLEKLNKPDWQHIETIFSVNVFSPVYSLEKFMMEGDFPKTFVSTISCVAMISLPAYSLYCSTKAALHHFMETYRYEQSKNLNLISVYPIATKTDFFDKATGQEQTPLPYPAQGVNSVAKAIVKGIEKNKKKIFPSLFFRFIYPIGRAFPLFLNIYSARERKKVSKWLDKIQD
ncbi:SDR family oxidoreductase [Dysgonomonas sp. 520]|uniref:SDR family NAD(P)-dependent oxidoreductase n=1 Tax=Dysgonomonas sp. 520 TaxID=2302931 RepID=UPI0013D834D1|nr:SDR family NAD(P)-dependent oxidoreductase [Dysgonomonas sp. 520]NDW08736.1 SDR family NAD(P)-dependent oxidoreductase [Dysgonomonas sp. 520]